MSRTADPRGPSSASATAVAVGGGMTGRLARLNGLAQRGVLTPEQVATTSV